MRRRAPGARRRALVAVRRHKPGQRVTGLRVWFQELAGHGRVAQTRPWTCRLHYGDRVNWAAITAIGTVFAGLALPLAFFQLGALRRDQLRAQVSKVGAWTGEPGQMGEMGEESGMWTIPVLVRNGSELPVRVDVLRLDIRAWGYERVLAVPEGTSEVQYYMNKRVGESESAGVVPGTIAPGETWSMDCAYQPETIFDRPQPPRASVTRVVITDAAGYQWEVQSGRAGPARRVRQWRRWWWKRRGAL